MLQFVLGNILTNKQAWCVADMKALLEQKQVKQVFYLVPEHIKFDSEMNVLTQLHHEDISGSIDIQIYSFSRLAWYLLKDTGVLVKQQLSKIGLSMLVRHVLLEKQSELVFYRTQINKQGFIKQLTDLFLEFRSGAISQEDFYTFFKEKPSDTTESQENMYVKMQELMLLYQAFNEKLIGKYIEKEDLYTQLAEHIHTMDLSNTAIYIDGFERFSAKEQQIILALMKKTYKVSVTLPLSKKAKEKTPLTLIPMITRERLIQLAQENSVRISEIDVTKGYERYSEDMQKIVSFWEEAFQSVERKDNDVIKQDALFIQEYDTKQEEVTAVINQISRLVATKHYRYKDFSILMRQVEDYEMILKPLCHESQIPYFIDNADTMASHPISEFLASLYAIQKRNWQYADMMRLLRSDLLEIGAQDDIDVFENDLLANGYVGKRWWIEDKEQWKYEHIRERIVGILLPYIETLEQASTMKDAAVALYMLCKEHGAVSKIKQWRDDFIAQGQLEKARQHEQAWQTFIQLLDEFVMVLGNIPFDLQTFYTVLSSGFEEAEYSLVPPTLDTVTISSLDGRRATTKKMIFVLGATSSQFPKIYDNKTLLSDEERHRLTQVLAPGHYLQLDTLDRTMVEPFVVYQLLASVTEQLYLFYPKTHEPKSTYIEMLEKRFDTRMTPQLLGKSKQVIRYLMKQIRTHYDTDSTLSLIDRYLIAFMQQTTPYHEVFKPLMKSFEYRNVPVHLTNALELYQGHLYLSVSQLESYFKDPYSHFLQYGLKLKERPVLSLTPADVGNVFHDTLDIFFEQVEQYEQEIDTLIERALTTVFDKPQYRLFQMTKSMAFSKELLTDTLTHVMQQLYQAKKQTNTRVIATEQVFDTKGSTGLILPKIDLLSDYTLSLRGKIDRIDVVNGDYLSVVDYKSSAKQFDLSRFYEGLSLQLITYLYVLEQNKKQLHLESTKTMGAFYYHVGYPYERVKTKAFDITDLAYTQEKFNGILSLSVEDVEKIPDVSMFYKVGLTKSNTFNKTKTMPTIESLDTFFDFLIWKIKQAGQRILSGDIPLSPIKDEPFTPSLNEFRSISLFDATLPENQYRKLLSVEDVLQAMKEKGVNADDTSQTN
ncbi:PD-(D/E)XK nuclease family protein [Carnobacteriaceae bacterium zg-ZUI78]|nr:PD-(D/E)XK nuclease family protein [Carnobacteriaceae bacterium zg-ZUI78]